MGSLGGSDSGLGGLGLAGRTGIVQVWHYEVRHGGVVQVGRVGELSIRHRGPLSLWYAEEPWRGIFRRGGLAAAGTPK